MINSFFLLPFPHDKVSTNGRYKKGRKGKKESSGKIDALLVQTAVCKLDALAAAAAQLRLHSTQSPVQRQNDCPLDSLYTGLLVASILVHSHLAWCHHAR